MGAGEKSDLIVIEGLTTITDSFGAEVPTWTEAFKVWAEYQPAGSREFPADQKRVNETTARFIIWYREDIHAATHRIVARGRTWNISEPQGDRKRMETTIEANEII